MYRCEDQTGTTVLTDNPAQLTQCSLLESSILPVPIDSDNSNNHRNDPHSPSLQIPKTISELHDHSITEEKIQATAQEAEITISLTKMGGSYVVQAHLNEERTAYLIVDTGASMTVLSTNIAIDLGILGTTDNELLTVNTAGGSVQVNMNYLSSLNVGNAQAKNVAVAIHDLPDIPEEIEGLLGMSFLKHFLVTLDAEHAQLILRPKQAS